MSTTPRTASLSSMIWQVADLLRGDFKPAEYGRIILPFTVLRRLDAVLAPTRVKVLKEKEKWESKGIDPMPFMEKAAGLKFVNTADFALKGVLGDPDTLVTRLFRDAQEAQLATITAADGTQTREVVMKGAAAPEAPEGGKVKLAPLSRIFHNREFGYV